uniref:RNase H type-1 domain-containing protein n=1 Tax=Strigamia maritima TaxID=126957 RepID=T1IYZ6_STRMM
MVTLPENRILNIKTSISKILKLDKVTVRDLASVIGKLNATTLAISAAPLHYRGIQLLKAKFLRKGHYESTCSLTSEVKNELIWWMRNLSLCKGRSLTPKPLKLVIASDASLEFGWGAVSNGVSIGFKWEKFMLSKHINILELIAAFWGLKSFALNLQDATVKLKIDNTTAVAAINRLGSPRSPEATAVAQDIWSWAFKRNLTLVAEHIPGSKNCLADAASRGAVKDSGDWKLDSIVFSCVLETWGPFSVDLFTNCRNYQFKLFFSWLPDPLATGFNALNQEWCEGLPYAFPPFALISLCLQRLRKSPSLQELVLITPVWPAQPWFPLLWQLSTQFPLLFPLFDELILDAQNAPHPLIINGALQLAAWRLSSPSSKTQEFQSKLPNWWRRLGSNHQGADMICIGKIGAFGQENNFWTLFNHLQLPSQNS